jgi:hypothetical protein
MLENYISILTVHTTTTFRIAFATAETKHVRGRVYLNCDCSYNDDIENSLSYSSRWLRGGGLAAEKEPPGPAPRLQPSGPGFFTSYMYSPFKIFSI